MENRSAVIKVLLFLAFRLRPSSAVTHTLEYSYTMVTPGSRFTSVALLDGEEFMYYDNNTAKMTPKTEWIKKAEFDSSYWEKGSVKFQRDWLTDKLNQIKVTEGVNTLQRVYGCEIDDKNITRGYDTSIYNGKDFISFNLTTGTWTAVDERAKDFTEGWNPANSNAAFWKNFLNRKCVDHLKSYIHHSTKKESADVKDSVTGGSEGGSEQRSDLGAEGGSEGGAEGGAEQQSDLGAEGGSDGGADERKTAVTVVVVLVLVAVAAVVGFVIYKKKLCAHLRSGYVAARQRPEQ